MALALGTGVGVYKLPAATLVMSLPTNDAGPRAIAASLDVCKNSIIPPLLNGEQAASGVLSGMLVPVGQSREIPYAQMNHGV